MSEPRYPLVECPHCQGPIDVNPFLSPALRQPASEPAGELLAAASELLALKDGPRDANYQRRKPQAWNRLRAALAAARGDTG